MRDGNGIPRFWGGDTVNSPTPGACPKNPLQIMKRIIVNLLN